MTTANLSVTVGGTEVNDPANGLTVISFATKKMVWNHEHADLSKSVHGETRIGSSLSAAQRAVGVRVKGTTIANFQTRFVALKALFWADGYEVIITWNSTIIEDWKDCSPADYSVGHTGDWDKYRLFQTQQEYDFTFESEPI